MEQEALNILKIHYIPLKKNDNIKSVRSRFEPIMVEQLVNVIDDYLDKKIVPKKQSMYDGKQFFVMSDKLVDIAESKLANYKLN